MKSMLTSFEQISGFPAIYEARNKGLGVFAIKLISGDICLFSPVAGLHDSAKKSLSAIGQTGFLFAPNHYHNKGLVEYSQTFPSARLVASAFAIPRLEKVTGLSFSGLDDLAAELPADAEIIQPDGLKTGETWMRVRSEKNTAWIVVDAFCGPKKLEANFDEPQLLKTFPKYGVGDRERYLSWLKQQIQQDQPTSLLTCHGCSISNAMLPEKLLALASSQL